MSIGPGLITYLETQSGVTTLIGNGDSPVTIRCYPMLLPQSPTYPACRYQVVTGEYHHALSGPVGRARPRVQVDVYAETYTAAKGVADALRSALDGYTGTMGSLARVSSRHVMEFDGYDVEPDGIYRITQDYLFSFE